MVLIIGMMSVYAQPKKTDAPKRKGWGTRYSSTVSQLTGMVGGRLVKEAGTIPIYGDVGFLLCRIYSLNSSGDKDEILECSLFRFNSEGNVIEMYGFNTTNGYLSRWNKYNYMGNKLEIIHDDIYSDPRKSVYIYDDADNMVSMEEYNSSGEKTSYIYSVYDSEKNILISKTTRVTSYKYDRFGNQIEEDIGWGRKFTSKNTYDSAGRLVRESRYSFTRAFIGEWLLTYDTAGNLIDESYFDSDNERVHHYSYLYDSYGNLVKISYKHSIGLEEETVLSYDTMGNIISCTHLNSKSEENRFIEFDITYGDNIPPIYHTFLKP